MSIPNRLSIALSAAVLLAGCSTMTPYEPAAAPGGKGYSEQRLESNRFKIFFSGNAQTPRQTVENYLLYRAAEVTLQQGYDYFVLVDQDTHADTRYQGTSLGPGPGFGYYGWYSWGPRWGVDAYDARPVSEYEAQANIMLYKGAKPLDDVHAFNASEVKANLEAVIQRPQPKS